MLLSPVPADPGPGDLAWLDRDPEQLPDGTFRWTTPAGRTYDTEPTRYPI